MITRLWANKLKQDFYPSLILCLHGLKFGLLTDMEKKNKKSCQICYFLKRFRKKTSSAHSSQINSNHVINVVILTRLVCTSKCILPYTDSNGSTETPQVPQCWVATLIGVCVCLCVWAWVKLGCHNVLWITELSVRDKERQCVCGSERQSTGTFHSHFSSSESFCFR